MKYGGLVTEKEYNYIKSKLNREPNDFELHLFSATYSEHCSYKHSKELLKLLPRSGAIFTDENAGGIEIGEHAILFKMESHNHPCAVEPFNGAATGVGGIIRDILAMNARPIALCNSLKFGSDERINNGVVSGISDYGNSIGVPTVSTEVLFDNCFTQNPLVNVSAIGIAKKSNVLTSNTAKSGLKLMLVGAATMKDGMGGAAFASKKLSREKTENKLSIQIANPFMKKKLIEACLSIFGKGLVVSCQDCGAAGILSSTSEIAYKSRCGVEIDLDKVHIGDKSIIDFEIMLSETQERMLFVVEEVKINEIAKILKKYQLEFSIIGETIKNEEFIVKKSGKILAHIPSWLLVTPPDININYDRVKNSNQEYLTSLTHKPIDANTPLIFEQYDNTVGARTQFQPSRKSLLDNGLQNKSKLKKRNTFAQSVANFNSLWIYEENCYLGVYTFSCVIKNDAFEEVSIAIFTTSEFLKNKGFSPIGITNCLNFTNPEVPPTMYEFRQTIMAIEKTCKTLQIPVCSGNVSFYNECSGGKIKNTPTFTMLGIKHINSSATGELK